MNELNGQVALVTGASRGLGEATARALAAQGVKLVLTARSGERISSLADEIKAGGGAALAVRSDVSDYASVESSVKSALETFGGINILVNNAGVIDPIAHIATSDPQAWAQSISINLAGGYNAVRAVLPHMLTAGKGTIVNISSGAAYRALEGWSAYCAGKAGFAMLTNALHMETGTRGIRAFGFSPGTIDTDMQATIRASGINAVSKIPRSDLFPVAHAVQGILYLCGADSSDLAGKDISVREEGFRKRIGLS